MTKIVTLLAALVLAAGISVSTASVSGGHTTTSAGPACGLCW